MTKIEQILINKKVEVSMKRQIKPIDSFVERLTQSDKSLKEVLMRSKNDLVLICDLEKDKEENVDLKKYDCVMVKNTKELEKFSKKTKLPILLNDYILCEYQIFEARLLGADALVLKASVLNREEINNSILLAKLLKMDVVLEIQNKEDLELALKTTVKIVAINNLNLVDDSIDLRKTIIFSPLLKKIEKLIISMYGLDTNEKIKLVKSAVNGIVE